MEYVLTATKTEAPAGSYYDKIAAYYDLTFKLNGYGRSLDQYFANHPLPVSRGAKILDAGCGTGLLTLALLRALHFPVSITALDLSATSISAARKAVIDSPGRTRDVTFAEGNLLFAEIHGRRSWQGATVGAALDWHHALLVLPFIIGANR